MCNFTDFKSVITCIVDFLEGRIVPILMSLAMLVFIWGVLKFIRNAGDEGERETGKQVMLWGLIGLFVMASVWSLVAILSGGAVSIPQL